MQHQGQRHTHFDVSEEADTLKNVASDSEATALASMVFPLPGGPNKSRPERQRQTFFMKQVLFSASLVSIWMLQSYKALPLAGLRRPVNKSLLLVGKITISIKVFLTFSRPAAEKLK